MLRKFRINGHNERPKIARFLRIMLVKVNLCALRADWVGLPHQLYDGPKQIQSANSFWRAAALMIGRAWQRDPCGSISKADKDGLHEDTGC
jgi:hypothetical protein